MEKKCPIEYADDILSNNTPPIIKHRKTATLYMYNQKAGHYSIIEKDDLKQYIYNHFLTRGIPKQWNPSTQNQILEAIRLSTKHVKPVDKLDDYSSLINLKNGIIDLDEVKPTPETPYTLIPHSPDYHFTATVEVPYDPTATTAPHFIKILKGIFKDRGADTYDKASLNSIIRLGGYILYPQNKVQKMFIFYGQGANGKSIIMEHVYKLFFTKEHMSSLSLNQLSNEGDFSRYKLIKSRINFATEQKAGNIESEELKKIISGETITIDKKNQDHISFEPNCKILIAANRLPYFKDTTYGTDRRLHIIMFPNKFMPKEEYDKEVNPQERGIYLQANSDEMKQNLKDEAPAILNMFLIALQELRQNNWYFPVSESSREIKKEYKQESDPVGSWIKGQYTMSKKESVEDIVTAKELLILYSKYHEDNSLSNRGLKITTKFMTKKVKELFNILPFTHYFSDPITSSRTSGPAFYLKKIKYKEDEILQQLQTPNTSQTTGDIPPNALRI